MRLFRLSPRSIPSALALLAALAALAPRGARAQERQIDYAALRDETVRAMSEYLQINTTNPPGNELATAKWLLPSRAETAALHVRHEELVLAIMRLEQQGGRVDLRRCGDPGRLCVRVDRKAPVFGQNSDYLVVAGY